MSSNNSSSSYSSTMGFSDWLTILFVGLKLTGYITWPWIWVLSPIWIGFLLAISIIFVMSIITDIADAFK